MGRGNLRRRAPVLGEKTRGSVWSDFATRCPTMPLQMLLRGRNTVGYTPYPTAVTDAFVREAAATGVDIFRIFDALNDVSQMRPAVMPCSRPVPRWQKSPCATPATCLTLPSRCTRLITTSDSQTTSCRRELTSWRSKTWRACFARPRHRDWYLPCVSDSTYLSTCTRTTRPVDSWPRCWQPVLPVRMRLMQPRRRWRERPVSRRCRHWSLPLLRTERDTGLDLNAVADLEPYWEAVRHLYAPFESGLPGPTGRVYRHEIPGGQLSNLRQQAIALGLSHDFELIEDMYAAADSILGRIPKVTPSSKVVGDLALHLAAVKADPKDFEAHPQNYDIPDSVIGFMAGVGGPTLGGRSRSALPSCKDVTSSQLQPILPTRMRRRWKANPAPRRDALNRLLFPAPTRQFVEIREQYGDVSLLDTADYLYGMRPDTEHVVEIERGVRLYVGLETGSTAGMR